MGTKLNDKMIIKNKVDIIFEYFFNPYKYDAPRENGRNENEPGNNKRPKNI